MVERRFYFLFVLVLGYLWQSGSAVGSDPRSASYGQHNPATQSQSGHGDSGSKPALRRRVVELTINSRTAVPSSGCSLTFAWPQDTTYVVNDGTVSARGQQTALKIEKPTATSQGDKWAVSFRASEATPKLLDELLESVSLECPLGLYNDQSWEAMACLSELRVTGELRCYTRHGVVLPLEAETSLVLFTWAQKKVSFAAFAILFLAVVALVFYWREGRCQEPSLWKGPRIVSLWTAETVRDWLAVNRVEPEVVEALLEDKVDGFGLMTLYFAPIRGDSKADFAFSSSKLVARACGRLESSGWVLTKNARPLRL